MKIFCQLLFVFLVLISTAVWAQNGYDVTGTVTNEKGEHLKGATIFIGGTERIMATGESGQFSFRHIPNGNFQLSVQMLGYAPETRNMIVKGAPIKIDIQLQAKAILLQQVTIGKENAREKNFKLFKAKFLGQSANAKQCVILNPEVINFSTKKGQLLADADELLVIENKRLGYRLHYLLGGFSYTHADGVSVYHGECSFEELDGTDEQKRLWVKNRLKTYQGSFMHFLRSVYANNTLENGFITKPIFGYGTLKFDNTTIQLHDRIFIDYRPISFDSLLTAIDTNFTSIIFRQGLYVTYDPKLAANFKPNKNDPQANVLIDPMGSVLRLTTNQAIIDKKGSYTDYHDFLSQGYWATARVGDQLPVDYNPPVADIRRRIIPINPLLVGLQNGQTAYRRKKHTFT